MPCRNHGVVFGKRATLGVLQVHKVSHVIKQHILNRRQCLLALASTGCVSLGLPASGALGGSHRWPTVQKTLEKLVSTGTAPGAAVAVSYNGSAPAYPAAGTLAFDSPRRFDENSICRVYSITKNVTRIAALLLVEDGRITLDQPVADMLPEFGSLRVAIDIEKGLESRPAANVMTMRHLLTNTSGLGSWTPSSDSGDALHALYRERGITPGNYGAGRNRTGYGPQVENLDEMVRRVAELPLAYEPGTRLNYSIGFDVMGLVIERVTGKRFDDFLHERLFGPLDMRSTGFHVRPENVARLTTSYDATRRADNSGVERTATARGLRVTDAAATSDFLKRPTLLSGGGGLLSTTRDFFRYGAMLLGEGSLDGVHIMKPATARLAFSNLMPAGVSEPSEGFGAGTRALLQPLIPAGTFGASGATGTLFWIDRSRRGVVVFLVQVMWGDPANHPYAGQLAAAVERDRMRTSG
jgi:CubicO group peptidase (beta-lactamase class C family)